MPPVCVHHHRWLRNLRSVQRLQRLQRIESLVHSRWTFGGPPPLSVHDNYSQRVANSSGGLARRGARDEQLPHVNL